MTGASAFQWGMYRLAARLGGKLPFPRKVAQSLDGRRRATEFWTARRNACAPGNPVVWFHAASVGEARLVEPVVRRLRASLPGMEAVLTYSSPSVTDWSERLAVDEAHFAPPEEPREVGLVYDAIKPDMLVFSRSDLWPEMLEAAQARGVPVAVIGGVVSAGSARLRWPVRSFLRRLYRRIRYAGAVADLDAALWTALGVPADVVEVTGDPRHDQVLEQPTELTEFPFLRRWAAAGATLVAGSVEAEDESVLLPAFARVLANSPHGRLVIVAHDPTPEVGRRLVSRAGDHGFAADVLTDDGDRVHAPCAIVARRGSLSSLYAMGALSYVGGGFRPGKLHAVIEPAAFGLPVIIGPEFAAAADAADMVSRGGAVALPRQGEVDALAATWIRWLRDDAKRRASGIAARRVLKPGAAGRTARRLLALLAR